MAGRFLLIEFDDENSANALRAQIDQASRNGKRFRVVGLFSRPGPSFCRCGTWTTERGKEATTKIGRKFGWAVCTVCGKPAPSMSFLRNLILPHQVIGAQTYEVMNKELGFYTYGLTAISLGAKEFEDKS